MELFAPPLALLVAVLTCRALLLPVLRRWFLDEPNARSLHVQPVPRTGGIGIILGGTAAALLLRLDGAAPMVLLAGMLAALSLLDDWKGLSASARFLAHLVAALALVLSGGWGSWSWSPAVVALIVLGIVWTTNLYNFMDGADGLAGGMAVFGFGTYAVAAWSAGDTQLALLSASISASALGFLLFNFPPAKMFMGDVGSIPLGFLAAGMGLMGWKSELWPLWFPVVAFAPFVVDATVTLGKRVLRRERIWQAHRSHYYQRQVLMGWSHRQLALAEYTLMGAGASVALVSLQLRASYAYLLLVGLGLVYLAVMASIDVRWAKRGTASA